MTNTDQCEQEERHKPGRKQRDHRFQGEPKTGHGQININDKQKEARGIIISAQTIRTKYGGMPEAGDDVRSTRLTWHRTED
jgi:hypothetical protein